MAAAWLPPGFPHLLRQVLLCVWGVGAMLAAERLFFSRTLKEARVALGGVRADRSTLTVAVLAGGRVRLPLRRPSLRRSSRRSTFTSSRRPDGRSVWRRWFSRRCSHTRWHLFSSEAATRSSGRPSCTRAPTRPSPCSHCRRILWPLRLCRTWEWCSRRCTQFEVLPAREGFQNRVERRGSWVGVVAARSRAQTADG